jgi:hypothetical protein
MSDEKSLLSTCPTEREIVCLDDVPNLARRSLWQQRIFANYYLVGFGPLFVFIVVVLKFFGNSTSKPLDAVIGLALCWPLVIAIYAFYVMFWGIRCPVCGHGFGTGEACRLCKLPRHQPTPAPANIRDLLNLFEEE